MASEQCHEMLTYFFGRIFLPLFFSLLFPLSSFLLLHFFAFVKFLWLVLTLQKCEPFPIIRNFIRRGGASGSGSGSGATMNGAETPMNSNGGQPRDLNLTEAELYKDRRKKDIHNMSKGSRKSPQLMN
jgi:hypothetical protein